MANTAGLVRRRRIRPVFYYKRKMLSEFEKKVADFAKANELFGSAEKILLAVSGGADSTALLYCVQRLLDEDVFNAQLLCAHINHQLRGYEADLDEQFVIGQAGELKLPIITRRVNVREIARRNKLSIETAARKLRIESLLDIAKANNCFFVATAHQKSDNAETILHRLLRGTGFRGLAGIWPVQTFTGGFTPLVSAKASTDTNRGQERRAVAGLDNSANMDTTQNTTISNGVKFVRPLLCVRRDEIIKYLQERNLKWREDHTNADCTYTRNYIRHRLLPALQADYTGSIVEELSLLAQEGRKLNCLVQEQTERVWPELAQTDENSVVLNLKTFILEPKLVRVELIRRGITAIGSGERDLTQRHYEKILQLAEQPAGNRKSELPGGFVVWCESGPGYGSAFAETRNLIFARPQRITLADQQITESIKLEVPGQTRFGRYLIEATILDAKSSCVVRDAFSVNATTQYAIRRTQNEVERFDLDRIKLPLTVRFRRRGDRFWPLGLAAEKKVGKFLTDAKVPQKMRSKTLIITDSERIIWVWPIRTRLGEAPSRSRTRLGGGQRGYKPRSRTPSRSRISEQPKVSSETRKILQLRITETEPP